MKKQSLHIGVVISTLFISTFLLTHCKTELPNKGNLENGFFNPPTENRPLAFWDWLNGDVDMAKMVYELEEMKDKGMQGAFIWDVGALIDPGKRFLQVPLFLVKNHWSISPLH